MPGRRTRRMLGGIPAYIWGVVVFVLVAVGCAVATVYIGVSVATQAASVEFVGEDTVLVVLVLTCGVGVAIALGAFTVRSNLEVENGYTTNPLKHAQVELCDWRTGVVLRQADEPLTGWGEFRHRRGRARRGVPGVG